MKYVLITSVLALAALYAVRLSPLGDTPPVLKEALEPPSPEEITEATLPPKEEPNSLPEEENSSISISPGTILQGDPALLTAENVSPDEVSSFIFNDRPLKTFTQDGKIRALVGIDLRAPARTYPVVVALKNGVTLRKDLLVTARKIDTAPLGIPEKLGGNTPESEKELINTLVQEGAIINSIPTADEKYWSGAFAYPVTNPIVTDVYGYSRQTGGSNISHKGTDFRAAPGTPVYAMNRGEVAFTKYLRNYGHTVVIDHGLGLQTIYMHLSEILVNEGEMVEKGDLIAKSGDSGYVMGAHLHLSLKIGGISVDPMKFLKLFGEG